MYLFILNISFNQKFKHNLIFSILKLFLTNSSLINLIKFSATLKQHFIINVYLFFSFFKFTLISHQHNYHLISRWPKPSTNIIIVNRRKKIEMFFNSLLINTISHCQVCKKHILHHNYNFFFYICMIFCCHFVFLLAFSQTLNIFFYFEGKNEW